MVSNYLLFPKAKEDLEAIFRYISIDLSNPEAASRLINKFESKFNRMMDYPESYPLLEYKNIDIDGLRKCFVDDFLIVFYINSEKNRIEIVRILHTRQDFIKEL